MRLDPQSAVGAQRPRAALTPSGQVGGGVLLGLDGIDLPSALLEQRLALRHLDASRQLSLVTAILSSQVRRGEEGCSERPSFVGDR